MKRKASISDVAAASGASMATVDRVLNGRGGVSKALAERVFVAARKLHMDRALEKPPEEWLHIGILMQRPDIPFYRHLAQLAANANERFASHRVSCSVIHYRSIEPRDVITCIEDADQRLDALIIVAQDHPAIRDALKKVARKKPVVTLITDLPDCGRLQFIGPDNRKAGRVAAELMGRFVGRQGGELLLVSGLRSLRGVKDREASFRAHLKQAHPLCHVIAVAQSREDQEVPEIEVRRLLRRYPQICGIYNTSVGDEGIARAVEDFGRASDIVLIAHDLNASSQELLMRGTMDAIIEQDSNTQLILAVRAIQVHLKRRSLLHVWADYGIRTVLRENLS